MIYLYEQTNDIQGVLWPPVHSVTRIAGCPHGSECGTEA